MSAKRPKADSAEAAVRAAVNAGLGTIQPPAHVRLRPGDAPFWDGIVCARARQEWTRADLVVAAQLSRCQYDIEVESERLYAESTVVENARGTMVANPRVMVLEQLARREMALMRSLRMGGKAAGDPRDAHPLRAAERKAREIREDLDEDDDLLNGGEPALPAAETV